MSNASGGAPPKQGGFLGFFSNLFSGLLAGSGTDAEREKRRLLKDVRKELKKRGKFYNLKNDLALVGLARWFYDIYKTIGPAQILLEKYGNSELLKTVLIESFYPNELREMVGNLHPDRIKERSTKVTDVRVLAEEVKDELIQIYAALDAKTVKNINKLYSDLHRLQAVLNFDYYFLLKKFDSMLPERDFVYNPRFEAINGPYIKEDLMDFLDVYYSLDPDASWDQLFDILKTYRNMELVSRNGWKKVLQGRKDMLKTRTLDLIVRHLEENPTWSAQLETTNHEIVEAYFNKIKTAADLTIQEVLRDRRKKHIENLLMKLFGTTAISRTQYYTERDNLTFHKKMLAGYTLVEPMNYLKAFFLDYYKSKVRTVVDLLLIQGKWATKISSQQFSDAYHQLLSQSDHLIAFDTSLADDGPEGAKIKRLLRSSARDKSALIALKSSLVDLNGIARGIINVSAQNLIILGKNIKQLLEEHKAQGSEIIINWKEVESWSDPPIEQQMSEVYAQIYYLVQLLQFFMKDVQKKGGK